MPYTVLVTARTMNEVGRTALDRLAAAGCRLVFPGRPGPLPADELRPQLAGVDAVLASMDRFSAEVLASPEAATLKVISRWGVGYDAIDVPAATRHGVVVAYTPGLLNETVADFAFALLLALARRVHVGHQDMSAGVWRGVWGVDVHGKTLGLLGCGRIGQAMARRAAGFDLRLLAYDIRPDPAAERLGVRFVSLEELLAASDFLSLHAALTPDSRGLLNEARLRALKPGACLINTARGALVDELALARVLADGHLGGAALDAFVTEPLPADHPLRSAPNVLLTPHLASFARETGERVSLAAAEAIIDLQAGRRPRWIVDPTIWDSPTLRAPARA